MSQDASEKLHPLGPTSAARVIDFFRAQSFPIRNRAILAEGASREQEDAGFASASCIGACHTQKEGVGTCCASRSVPCQVSST